MDMSQGVPHIKQDAIVRLEIGTAFIAQLQHTYEFLLKGHTPDEAKVIRDKVQAKEPLNDWENSLMCLTQLIATIHAKAQEQGMVTYISMEETLSSAI